MRKGVNNRIFYFAITGFIAICSLVLTSCENSLNDIQKINSKEEDRLISRSTGVDVIYSDSARVKMRIQAPLLIDYQDVPKPYKELPKGVKVIFFDDSLKEKGNIVSDWAVQREKENIIEFRKNVVATNVNGEVFKSDELIYDMNTKKMYSTKPVQILMAGGNIMNGVGADSNDSFMHWHIQNSTGVFHVDEKSMQQ